MTSSEKVYVVNQAFRKVAKHYIDKGDNDTAVHVLQVMDGMQLDGDFARTFFFDAIVEIAKSY